MILLIILQREKRCDDTLMLRFVSITFWARVRTGRLLLLPLVKNGWPRCEGRFYVLTDQAEVEGSTLSPQQGTVSTGNSQALKSDTSHKGVIKPMKKAKNARSARYLKKQLPQAKEDAKKATLYAV